MKKITIEQLRKFEKPPDAIKWAHTQIEPYPEKPKKPLLRNYRNLTSEEFVIDYNNYIKLKDEYYEKLEECLKQKSEIQSVVWVFIDEVLVNIYN